ncbi:MAG: hypothetical protein ACRDO2_02990, partial [Nocardioidaceae bacterium]
QIAEFSTQLNRVLAQAGSQEGPRWPGQGIMRGALWLTDDETRDVLARVSTVIEEYSKGRGRSRHPKGARKLAFLWSLIPADAESRARHRGDGAQIRSGRCRRHRIIPRATVWTCSAAP